MVNPLIRTESPLSRLQRAADAAQQRLDAARVVLALVDLLDSDQKWGILSNDCLLQAIEKLVEEL